MNFYYEKVQRSGGVRSLAGSFIEVVVDVPQYEEVRSVKCQRIKYKWNYCEPEQDYETGDE